MKYKIHYKANDYAKANIIKFLKFQGYEYLYLYHGHTIVMANQSQEEIMNTYKLSPEERKNIIYFEVDLKNKTIFKYDNPFQKPNFHGTLFTKEELKFFDILDYETRYEFPINNLRQEITDWINM